jgi:hypothetical protein
LKTLEIAVCQTAFIQILKCQATMFPKYILSNQPTEELGTVLSHSQPSFPYEGITYSASHLQTSCALPQEKQPAWRRPPASRIPALCEEGRRGMQEVCPMGAWEQVVTTMQGTIAVERREGFRGGSEQLPRISDWSLRSGRPLFRCLRRKQGKVRIYVWIFGGFFWWHWGLNSEPHAC